MEADIGTRIATARQPQWLGDLTQLEQTLARVQRKRSELVTYTH